MKRRKRILSIILSLAVAVSMIPMFGVTAGAAEMCTVTFHNNGHGTLKVESVQIEKGKNLNGSGTLYFRDTLMGKADGLEHISWGRTPTATVAGPDHFNMNSAVTESMDLYAIWSPYIDTVKLSLPEKPSAGGAIRAEPEVTIVSPTPMYDGDDLYYIHYSDAEWIKDTVWLDDEGNEVKGGTFKDNAKYTLRVLMYSNMDYNDKALPFSVDTNFDADMKSVTLDGKEASEVEGNDYGLTMWFDYEIGVPVTKYQWEADGAVKDEGLAVPGETVTITAIEDGSSYGYHYQFDHWTVESGGVILANPKSRTTTFTMPANNVHVKAVWKEYSEKATVEYTADSEAVTGGSLTADAEAAAEMDDALMEAFLEGNVTYQWYKNNKAIQGATGETLKLDASMGGAEVYAEVSFGNIVLKTLPVTVEAVVTNPFVDVTESDYFYEPVLWALKKDITKGTDDTHFSPEDTCTRAQVVTFLWRAAGSPAPGSYGNPFTDVSPSDYYYKAVLWAVGKNITTGLEPTTFGPEQGCTRGQVVTFLHRFEKTPVPSTHLNPFTDVSSSEYYYTAVLWAVGKNITTGLDPITFGPNETCTRGQIVTFLYRDMN